MAMKDTVAVVSQMEADGIFGRYAISGAVAAFLYIEVSYTEDLDILVSFEEQRGRSGLITLDPVLDYLKEKGFTQFNKEGVVVHGWPVQFLPVATPLDEEGLREAVIVELPTSETTIPCRILRAEHLMATALKVGRPKDHIRLTQFIEAGKYDKQYLCEVLERHGLVEPWAAFCEKYDVGEPCS